MKLAVGRDVKLKNGTRVVVRPMNPDDLDRSFTFFQTIPAEDRAYLRHDVSRRDVVEERIRSMDSGRIRRLVAVAGDRIVADATLELESQGWKQHVAEMRLVVAPSFQRRGLGTLMAREGCCAVRVPLPERFAIHKLVVSRLRSGRAAKSGRDVYQAAVLCAALAETHAGAIESAVAAVSKRAAKHFRAALPSVQPILETAAPRAWEELSSAHGK